jgi:hypothetical protein
MSQDHFFVIPAKAKIRSFQWVMDSGVRRSDGIGTFNETVKIAAFTSE